ncbi:MAG: PCRF domain-containing protein [Deltaproteobacteria bacterium]|nr:PCRF domain-containing protein [Deltaproteobacteria bacterium]
MSREGFWDSPENAEALLKERKSLETFLFKWSGLEKSLEDLRACLDLFDESGDASLAPEVELHAGKIERDLDEIELDRMLAGDDDERNAILTIHAGAGGTESQDWAEMLLRMYLRFADRTGFEVEVLERQEGEEAGIKNATILLSGDHPYGYMKAEM